MAISNDHRGSVYSVTEKSERFEVRTTDDRVVMVCANRGSAEHYAALLNAAYQAGYKAGFKTARSG